MSKAKTGGPAFPSAKGFRADSCGYGANTSYEFSGTDAGMTLRDYFAAKVMQGYIVGATCPNDVAIAATAYRIADAMLAAREVQS